jgi:2-hydroxychromene-2-carboxylate isomerase
VLAGQRVGARLAAVPQPGEPAGRPVLPAGPDRVDPAGGGYWRRRPGRTTDMTVTFWFDPSCPFTWRTGRWLRSVAETRGEQVRWRLMSLARLNADKEMSAEHRQWLRQSRLASRVLAATEAEHGSAGLDAVYTALGKRVHEQGQDLSRSTVEAALGEAGLPGALLAAYEDEQHDAAVLASHDESQQRVGDDAGSPVVALGDGPGFFGPIVTDVPTAEAADRLFDAVRLLSSVVEFSELKRARRPAHA